ncbi:hypothetical protein B0H14DRAFT_2610473 [Mycena olivaceomarginata]|nr:hypothetical protein B0H14DRAFT_2610473 [Mycena olivaceomarginata]
MTIVAWVLKRIEKTGMQALAAEQIKGARRLYILAYNLEKEENSEEIPAEHRVLLNDESSRSIEGRKIEEEEDTIGRTPILKLRTSLASILSALAAERSDEALKRALAQIPGPISLISECGPTFWDWIARDPNLYQRTNAHIL